MSNGSRFFGRRKGRPLHVRKAHVLKELLPQMKIELPGSIVGGSLSYLPPETIFKYSPTQIWLEIGFGGGEHLAVQAERHPDIGFIGCEPFLNGIASLLDHIDQRQLKNIRIFPDDARLLLDVLPLASIARCFILFADPWPKKRHQERRFVGAENLPRLARVLQPGAELYLATDDRQLSIWMRESLAASTEFISIYDSMTPPTNWVPTRYQQKGIAAGRMPTYFIYRRSDN